MGRVWDDMLCTCVKEEGGDREGTGSEVSSLLSYTLRYVSLTELDTLCQFGLREPIHLCACVSEEGGDGEGVVSEAQSLLSYTLKYVSLTKLVTVYLFGLRPDTRLTIFSTRSTQCIRGV